MALLCKRAIPLLSRTALETATARTMATSFTLTPDGVNENIKTMEYAVRGPIVVRAVALQKEITQGAKKPFADVIRANIGDAHAMGQKPITYIRQIMACVSDPTLIDNKDVPYPQDVRDKARQLLGACGGGSVGAYTLSTGIELIRENAAKYIAERDGHPADADNIVLSGGASESIRNLLKLFIDHGAKAGAGKQSGVMIPIPQYPLYSASVAEFGLHQIGYYLDEANNWALSIDELQRSLDANKDKCRPRVLCVINPGNPTGQVLSRDNIEQIIKFAHNNKLFLFADEVYQDNVYAAGCAFHSFKKVLTELGPPYSTTELASFMSVSKGYMGECGQRGGYAEIINVHPDVMALFKKSISAKLCSTAMGQVVMNCVVDRPKQGDPSYDLWQTERTAVLDSLKARATSVQEAFSSIEGITCNPVQGAMYAFPQIAIPPKAVAKAKELGQQPDFFYCMSLLEEQGICVVPGSGFGQRDNTYHFRTTILPQPALMEEMLRRFKTFHTGFMQKYS